MVSLLQSMLCFGFVSATGRNTNAAIQSAAASISGLEPDKCDSVIVFLSDRGVPGVIVAVPITVGSVAFMHVMPPRRAHHNQTYESPVR